MTLKTEKIQRTQNVVNDIINGNWEGTTKIIFMAEMLPDCINVKYLLVASNEFYVDVWNMTARLGRRENNGKTCTILSVAPSDEARFSELAERIIYEENEGAINISGHYFPITPKSAVDLRAIAARAGIAD